MQDVLHAPVSTDQRQLPGEERAKPGAVSSQYDSSFIGTGTFVVTGLPPVTHDAYNYITPLVVKTPNQRNASA